MHSDLTLEAKPLPDNMRGLVEHLAKISSALLLNHYCGCEDAEILKGNAFDQVVHCGLQFQAVILLLETSLEFAAHWISAFASHRAHCGDEAVSGAQSTYHQIQGFRQPLLKRVKALAAFMKNKGKRRGAQQQSNRQS